MNKLSRNDSILYTGVVGASSGLARKAKLEAQKKAKEDKRIKLEPYQEVVFAEIAKDRASIASEVMNLIHAEMSEADVKATVLGLRQADARLASLQSRLGNILRRGVFKESSNE